jgi:hypothetical protein
MKSTKPFFERKNLLLITGIVLVGYISIWGGVLIKNKIDHSRKSHAAKVEQTRINNLSKEEKAIKKAQENLTIRISLAGTSERIFFTYLQRKFDLPAVLGAQGPPMDLHEDPKTYPEQNHFLARIAYPDKVVTTLPNKAALDDNAKITNIYSVNCDVMQVPNSFWQTMGQSIKLGDYYMSHVALALAFMKDNACLMPPIASDMKTEVEQGLVKLADNPTSVADLRYEAVAFLYLSGRSDLVKSSWIDQIVAEQHKDGMWSYEAGGTKADYHATLLALWSLLEYSRPNTPDEPLIRRPTQQP